MAKGKLFGKSILNGEKEIKAMADEQYREIRVYEQSGYKHKPTPTIILKGAWLAKLGFEAGDLLEIKCEKNKLVITKTEAAVAS